MENTDFVEEVEKFHGHMCPGVAIGIQAARLALAELGRSSDSNDVVAVVETNMCAVDGIQYLLGCTFGRGSLIHLDHGKNAYSFVRTGDGKSLRLTVREGAWQRDAEHEELLSKTRSGQATELERVRYWELQREVSTKILEMTPDRTFQISYQPISLSRPQRDMHYRRCTKCGEMTNVSRLTGAHEAELCLPCSKIS